MWPLLHWKSNKNYIFWVCVCSLSYPVCNARVRSVLPSEACLAVTYFLFAHYLINGHDFRKNYWIQNVCFKFLYTFFCNISYSQESSARYYHKFTYIDRHVQQAVILDKFEWNSNFLNSLFSEKSSNNKFYEDAPSGSRVFPCGQTDMMKLIVAFRNFVNAPIKRIPKVQRARKRWKTRVHTLKQQNFARKSWRSLTALKT